MTFDEFFRDVTRPLRESGVLVCPFPMGWLFPRDRNTPLNTTEKFAYDIDRIDIVAIANEDRKTASVSAVIRGPNAIGGFHELIIGAPGSMVELVVRGDKQDALYHCVIRIGETDPIEMQREAMTISFVEGIAAPCQFTLQAGRFNVAPVELAIVAFDPARAMSPPLDAQSILSS